MSDRPRPLPRIGAATAAGLVLVAVPVAAAAHVNLDPSTTAAGSSVDLSFSFSHGCGTEPTTALAFQVPEELASVNPNAHAGWTIETTTEELAEPVDDGHGGQRTERTAVVTFTAEDPVPDGIRDTVVLSTTLPADLDGETLAFPVVQQCGSAESAWIQLAEDGQDPHDLDSPAPVMTIGTATDEGHGDHSHEDEALGDEDHAQQETGSGESETTTEQSATETDGTAAEGGGTGQADGSPATTQSAVVSPLGIGAVALGLIGAVTGTLALLRTRRG